MKKIALAGLVIIVFIAYILYEHPTADSHSTDQKSTSASSSSSSVSNITYKDGRYTGSVADAFYGNIQVQAVVSGGKLTDVVFLQYPNDQRESQEINGQSNPALKQEAIQAQSANVQIVSGATQSSQAFQQSLQAALDQAKS